ncbi:MAG: hypothetical protein ACTHMT_02465 [Verrucomicrobiota bacterium]
MKNTACEQMELLMNQNKPALVNYRRERQRRAQWWFQKMRQVVELAIPQHPRNVPPPRQTYFNLQGGRA